MAELPIGTVTLLFTDIEGSTGLLKSLGDVDYERLLSDHRGLLRRAFNLYGGLVVDREGDSFFVVFRRAKDAVSAALEAQRSLAAHPWPGDCPVRVRMGIHTGEPVVRVDGLTGLAVHRAARICAAAHGGQVLLSSTTGEILEDDLPEKAVLKDLGEQMLKDFDRPGRLLQLVADDLEPSFPPLRTDGAGPDSEPSTAHDSAPLPPTRRGVSVRAPGKLARPFRKLLRRSSLDVVGYRIHSMAVLSPEPMLASAFGALGGAIVELERRDRALQASLRSVDRRAIERRLDKVRGAHFHSARGAYLADQLARRLAVLDEFTRLRSTSADEIERIEARTDEMRRDIFQARLGRPLPPTYTDEIGEFVDSIRSLNAQMQALYTRGQQIFDGSSR